jgi:hypothetical protein
MKKTILLITVMCCFALSVTEAQISKGRSLAGVSTSFSYVNFGSDIMSLGFTTIKQKSNAAGYTEPDAQKITTLNFLPKFGYFAADNFVVGLEMCLASSAQKSGQSKYSMTYFGIGPFARYYLNGARFMPYFEVSSLFGSVTSKSQYIDDTFSEKSRATSIAGGFGLAVRLDDKVTFDIMAGYNSMTGKRIEDNPDNERTVQGTIGFKFGFVALLGSN